MHWSVKPDVGVVHYCKIPACTFHWLAGNSRLLILQHHVRELIPVVEVASGRRDVDNKIQVAAAADDGAHLRLMLFQNLFLSRTSDNVKW